MTQTRFPLPVMAFLPVLLAVLAAPAAAQAPVVDWSERPEVVYRSESVGAYVVGEDLMGDSDKEPKIREALNDDQKKKSA